MLTLFRYNWQVRADWFDWSESVPTEELTRQRTGGVGSILRTLFHVVDVEQAWILQGLQGKPEFHYHYEDYDSLDAVRNLSDVCSPRILDFVMNWSGDLGNRKLDDFTYGEVLLHVVAHEIHHMGQLSVWAREVGREPISANVIGRNLM